jgi:hypothetical protein
MIVSVAGMFMLAGEDLAMFFAFPLGKTFVKVSISSIMV